MAEALGLVGGAGALPALMAREARRAGWRVVAFALAPRSPWLPMRIASCRAGSATWARSCRCSGRRRSATSCSPAGSGRTRCSRARPWTRPRGISWRRRPTGRTRDCSARRRRRWRRWGSRSSISGAFLVPWLVSRGWVAGPPVAEPLEGDVARGLELARELARRGVGQTVVLRGGSVAAVEAMEGTDEAVRRGLALAGRGRDRGQGGGARARLPVRRAHRRPGHGGVLRRRRGGGRWRWRPSACSCSTASASRRRRPGRG